MTWVRYFSLAAAGIAAVLRRVPLSRIIAPIQLGVIQTAKEAGNYGRKALIFAVLAFAVAYWWDKLDIRLGYEIPLATHKVG